VTAWLSLFERWSVFISGSSLVIEGGYTRVDYLMKEEADALAEEG
jgi:hypothetical protein